MMLTCRNHPTLRWSCKEIAWSEGRYNGQRNIFFHGTGTIESRLDVTECPCPPSDLILAPEAPAIADTRTPGEIITAINAVNRELLRRTTDSHHPRKEQRQ